MRSSGRRSQIASHDSLLHSVRFDVLDGLEAESLVRRFHRMRVQPDESPIELISRELHCKLHQFFGDTLASMLLGYVETDKPVRFESVGVAGRKISIVQSNGSNELILCIRCNQSQWYTS